MKYISIRTSTIRGDQKIGFNTYVQIDEKTLLYLKKGDSFEGPRLKKFKDKKIKKMFILTDEESLYLKYLDENINIAYDNKSGKDIQNRADIIQGDQQANTEQLFENPSNAASYDIAKNAAAKYVDFILSNTHALSSVMSIQNIDQSLTHHGVTVATLAIALASKLGINNEKQTQLLTLGSLLHDFGHFDSTVSHTKSRKQMQPDELKTYLTHSRVGAEKIRDKKHFDQTVINIILQHEELINGAGPQKLSEKQTDPLAVIVSACNALDRLIINDGVAKNMAAKTLMLESVGAHPLQYIQFLGDILKTT